MNPLSALAGQLLALIAKQVSSEAKSIASEALTEGYEIAQRVVGFGQNFIDGKLTLEGATNLALGQWDSVKIVINTAIGEAEIAAEKTINGLQSDFVSIITGGFGSLVKLVV